MPRLLLLHALSQAFAALLQRPDLLVLELENVAHLRVALLRCLHKVVRQVGVLLVQQVVHLFLAPDLVPELLQLLLLRVVIASQVLDGLFGAHQGLVGLPRGFLEGLDHGKDLLKPQALG